MNEAKESKGREGKKGLDEAMHALALQRELHVFVGCGARRWSGSLLRWATQQRSNVVYGATWQEVIEKLKTEPLI